MKLFNLLKVLSLFAFVFLAVPKHVSAASNFSTDYHVVYNVGEDGIAHTVLQVALTNNVPGIYASSYKMQLGFDDLKNIHATDPDGPINPVIEKNADGYTVSLSFNKKSVGLGGKLPFTLTFDTNTIAKRYGKIWEIDIPGIANPEDFTTFVVDVNVPPSFGKPIYTKPSQPISSLSFTKQQLGKSGISIAFGTQQLFAYHLTYHLQDDKVYPIRTEIALPPSTNYQDVYVTSINPRPSNVIQDKDGNWLAQYTLFPSQKMDVIVDGNSSINLRPKQATLSAEDRAAYTSQQQYWESNSDEIRELADELRTPDAIYDYVVKTLKYDFSRVTDDKGRLGALGALKNQTSAVCLEYTDLFVAIARAAGIPAREIDGFAYTENSKQRPLSLVKDILHAWPEYYDDTKKTWVMVDPTWGSTTGGVDYFSELDFDHFAFAIKGRDSSYPVAAGGYKFINGKDTKDVAVSFADSLPDTTPEVSVTSDFSSLNIAGFPINGNIIVENNGNGYISPQLMYLTSQSLAPHNQMQQVSGIPPFGKATVAVHFDKTSFLTNLEAPFTIQLAGKTTNESVAIKPFFLTIWGIGAGLLLILILFVSIFGKGKKRK